MCVIKCRKEGRRKVKLGIHYIESTRFCQLATSGRYKRVIVTEWCMSLIRILVVDLKKIVHYSV